MVALLYKKPNVRKSSVVLLQMVTWHENCRLSVCLVWESSSDDFSLHFCWYQYKLKKTVFKKQLRLGKTK